MEEAARQIIPYAQILTRAEGSVWGDRAYCPLCKDGSTAPYDRGFSVPEGLYRHLIGFGNVHQCVVMDAAFKLILDSWGNEFRAVEERERREKLEHIAQRKQTEILYRLAPNREPEFIDNSAYGSSVRNDDQLSAAESRIRELGLEIILEANVKSYICDYGDLVVYADPRLNGRIDFSVYKKSTYKRTGSLGTRFRELGSFYLLDSWKQEIRQKYQERLSKFANS